MYDRQLELLTEVLKRKKIWAINIGENFNITLDAWQRFANQLPQTAVSYLYVSEHHLLRTDLKKQMRDAIRQNCRCASRQNLRSAEGSLESLRAVESGAEMCACDWKALQGGRPQRH